MINFLLTYDINIETNEGKKRLRKCAKICENYGVRVQNSVFELQLQQKQMIKLKNELESIIDKKLDSIRIYVLNKGYDKQVEIIGKYEKIEITKDNGFIF